MSEFLEIARKYSPLFNEGRFCPGQYIGKIHLSGRMTTNPKSNLENSDFLERIDIDDFSRTGHPIIILVTESPHKSEFDGVLPRPVAGNGNGDAGRAIRNLFNAACPLRGLIDDGEYPLVVMNAIQYQCSLGEATKKFRDKVFKECWNDFGRQDFQDRLIRIYRRGDVVINACTAGNDKRNPLRKMVKNAIEAVTSVTDIEVEHPSSWGRTYNMARKNGCVPDFGWKK